jgi:hypothetical protein
MICQILLGSGDKLSMWEMGNFQALRFKLAFDGPHRRLQGQGPGGHGHACAEFVLL